MTGYWTLIASLYIDEILIGDNLAATPKKGNGG